MRIAIVSGPYIPVPPVQYGGTEQVISYLINGLKLAGHEPILLAPADSKADCRIIPTLDKATGFPKTADELKLVNKKIKLFNRNTNHEISKLLPEIDLIHSHTFDLTKFKDFPNLTTIHGAITLDNYKHYEERKDLNYIAISKNQMQSYSGLNYKGVVYNGEDLADFKFVEKPQKYLCYLGRFDTEKSPHIAIDLAISRNIKIKIAGKIDVQGREYFDKIIRPYLRHPLVEYLGELGFKDKVKLLSNAMCNLHPVSFREPFGLTVVEAAMCGTPTFAIRRGSMPEVIENGKTGLLVEDFIEGYSKLDQCFSLNRKYIARRTAKLFNYKKMTEGYIKAYKTVLKQSKNNKNS